MIKWAGWLMVLLSAGHLLSGLVLTAPEHAGAWFTGALWGEDLSAMSPANGAFWLTLGGFGVSQILLGAMVLWLDRRGITPPQFIPWTLLVMSLVGAVIWQPAPWPVDWLSIGLLLVGIRRARRAETMTQGVSVGGGA
ncbi:DUF6463 family protein [Allokutzneria sp. A3M-2-11 16]|uniref:DUF6463 family protein n=1 Tax=Allokutzneria sp. A3M-2-11 16 TaxID=2962043 RepID=UPI0020B7FEE3|nr:DUF6463 family protein [Allokutzneria sp. A3M-2-11 16]MCP3805037.1 DUF6463 family protein [Allokutzneria sp. A3M-2-11 16]